jgi:hypothetical protein
MVKQIVLQPRTQALTLARPPIGKTLGTRLIVLGVVLDLYQ